MSESIVTVLFLGLISLTYLRLVGSVRGRAVRDAEEAVQAAEEARFAEEEADRKRKQRSDRNKGQASDVEVVD